MHGVIHVNLREFALKQVGEDGWEAIRREARLGDTRYVTSLRYPDDEVPAVFLALARRTGEGVGDLVGHFGECLAGALMDRYRVFVEPSWRTLDLIEHTETVIHRAVRVNEPTAGPPRLSTKRVSEDEVRVIYTSDRQLCALGKGIIRGVA